jgi:SanA protein
MNKIVKRVIIGMIIVILVILIILLGINFFVIAKTKNKILTEEQAKELEDVDCILVLGAGIWGENPSPMLEDRLLQGISLYQKGISHKMIMSGDHGRDNYDEVNVMKRFAIERNVKSEDVFMDHAGFSTYDSMYRAKDVFEAKKILIVTQKYHMYRAIYVAEQLGMEAYGVNSDPQTYAGQAMRDFREVLARDKDWIKCIIKPEPTYLGETIPVSGNGDVTNDK